MVHIIGDIGTFQKCSALKIQMLSCMEKETKFVQKDIFNSECIQRRIDEAAKVRAKLEEEIAKRDENIKKINFLG